MPTLHNMIILPDVIEQVCQILKEKNANWNIDESVITNCVASNVCG